MISAIAQIKGVDISTVRTATYDHSMAFFRLGTQPDIEWTTTSRYGDERQWNLRDEVPTVSGAGLVRV